MPNLVKTSFSDIDLNAITDAVGEAEKTTSAEIAVRIASQSYSWRAERLIVAGALALVGFLLSLWVTRTAEWGILYDYQQATLWAIVGFAVGYYATSALLQGKPRKARIVWRLAQRVFVGLKATTGKTGILIFISLKERRAAIIVDEAVAEAFARDFWEKPIRIIVDGMKSDDHAEGLIQAIAGIGSELADKLPRRPDDENEIPDRPESI